MQALVAQKQEQEPLLKQLTSLKFLLRQGLAIRSHEDTESNLIQLLELRSDDCFSLKAWLRE